MKEESLWEGEVVGADAGARCSGFCLGKHVGMQRSAARARQVAWEPQDMSLRVAGKRTI